METDDSHLDDLPPAMQETLLSMRQSRRPPPRFGYRGLAAAAVAALLFALVLAALL
jgi:hypothetical protein